MSEKLDYSIFYSDKDNVFTRKELDLIFDSCKGKKFGELDRMKVFAKALANPKVIMRN